MSLILKDTFHGVNGTALDDHTPEVGGPWVIGSGTPVIQSNKLHVEGASFSTVAIAKRTLQAALVFDEPTLDADGKILLYAHRTPSAGAYTAEIGPDGVTKMYVAGDAGTWTLNPGVEIPFRPTGNVIRWVLGPSTVKAWFNDQLIGIGPRVIPATLAITSLSIQTNDADTVADFTEIVCNGLGTT